MKEELENIINNLDKLTDEDKVELVLAIQVSVPNWNDFMPKTMANIFNTDKLRFAKMSQRAGL